MRSSSADSDSADSDSADSDSPTVQIPTPERARWQAAFCGSSPKSVMVVQLTDSDGHSVQGPICVTLHRPVTRAEYSRPGMAWNRARVGSSSPERPSHQPGSEVGSEGSRGQKAFRPKFLLV